MPGSAARSLAADVQHVLLYGYVHVNGVFEMQRAVTQMGFLDMQAGCGKPSLPRGGGCGGLYVFRRGMCVGQQDEARVVLLNGY